METEKLEKAISKLKEEIRTSILNFQNETTLMPSQVRINFINITAPAGVNQIFLLGNIEIEFSF